jgi:hypothetical protein
MISIAPVNQFFILLCIVKSRLDFFRGKVRGHLIERLFQYLSRKVNLGNLDFNRKQLCKHFPIDLFKSWKFPTFVYLPFCVKLTFVLGNIWKKIDDKSPSTFLWVTLRAQNSVKSIHFQKNPSSILRLNIADKVPADIDFVLKLFIKFSLFV